ncbi:hypothetical protein AWC11_07335 [Mycobacterium interjectum]|nr:hypothetical protein AWC11_07335 [Mycobacterium interjectum]
MPQVITVGPGTIYSADGHAMPIWTKDPFDVKDYTLDWSLLLAPGDTIEAVTFVVAPGFELTVLSTNFTDTTATCWLQGGVLDETYSVTCQVTTADGRQQEYSFDIICGKN